MITVKLKPITWLGDSRNVVRDWPEPVRKRAGEEMFRLQIGSEPMHWRSMRSVGRGVREIKISAGGQHRVFYLLDGVDHILVLHAFEKKTRRTARGDLEIGRQRLKSWR